MLKITDGRDAFFQWDTAQTLTVENEPDETVAEVHIGHEHGNVYSFEPVDGVVTVPDELLQCSEKIAAFEWIKVTDGGYTTRKYTFHVAKRPKVDNYTYTPTKAQSWEYWSDLAKSYAERAELALSEVPGAMRDYWREHKDDFKGDPGEPGRPGEPGQPGYTPIKGVDYFDGAPGAPGYTPIKGVDYFDGAPGAPGQPGNDYVITESDYEAIAERTKELVPTYDDTAINKRVDDVDESIAELSEEITETIELTQADFSASGGVYVRTDGSIGSDVSNRVNFIPCKKNTTYRIETVGTILRIGTSSVVPAFGVVLSQFDGSANTVKTITTDENASYLVVYTYKEDFTCSYKASKLDNKVGFEDYATSNKGGVIKPYTPYGMNISNGIPYLSEFNYQQYLNASHVAFIGKGTLENVLAERLKEPQFELIEALVLTEDTTLFERTAEPNGNLYNFKAIRFEVGFNGNLELQTYIAININGTTPYRYLSNDTVLMRQLVPTNANKKMFVFYGAESKYREITASCKTSGNNATRNATSVTVATSANVFEGDAITRAGLTTYIASGYGLLYAGTEIKIYGVRA